MTGNATITGSRHPRAAVTWDDLAHQVAASGDRDEVTAMVDAAAEELGVDVDLTGPLVVLQRTFGHLHRLAVTTH